MSKPDTRDFSEPTPMRDEPKKHGDSLGDAALSEPAADRPANPLNGDSGDRREGETRQNEPPHLPQQ